MRYLLIHGSWHGAWCWYKIAPRLIAEGHTVSVPDLPGRINNPALSARVGLSSMVRSLSRELDPVTPTTIVVHSRYGIVASALAEAYPDRVAGIVYLAAFAVPHGRRAADYFRKDKGSMLSPHITVNPFGLWDRLDPVIYDEALYHDCSADDAKLGHLLLGREPLRPALKRLTLSDAKFGTVQKSYIRLTRDRAVTPWLQDRFINDMAIDRVEDIPAGHSAYFSTPDRLTQTILKLT